MNNNLVEEIERLNSEIIFLQQSKEYRLGKKILHFKKLIKEFKIMEILKKIIRSKKMEKLILGQFQKRNDVINKSVHIESECNKKILVYTCITGSYDEVPAIYLKESCCDYVLVTNNKNLKSDEWKIFYVDDPELSKYNNMQINRYFKMNPSYFKDYDYSIYVDGNIEIISTLSDLIKKVDNRYGIAFHKHKDNECIYDESKLCIYLKKGNKEKILELMDKYKAEGFPVKYGLPEANVIVTDLSNSIALKIFEDWWNKLNESGCGRDQLILPYVLWKNNINVSSITTLGENVYQNYKIRIRNHN